MHLCWGVSLYTILLVPVFGSPRCTEKTNASKSDILYASSALASLHCHNDFRSYIRCSWTESAQMSVPLTLYHWEKSSNSASPCLPYGPPVRLTDGRFKVHCQYNTSYLEIGVEDNFFFKTSCPPGLSKSITPIQHVRLVPPHNLSQQATEGGGTVLKWQDPPHPPSLGVRPSHNYRVSYRRSGQDWTEVEVSELELKLEARSLVPGCEYEAKVRVREDTGLWSQWSPSVVWRTEDVPGPANLQCVFDGQREMSCSWEVHRELAQLITYRLSYNQSLLTGWCGGARHSGDAVLRFSCSFPVSDPKQQLWLELLPVYNTKVILPSKNIQLSPPQEEQVTERDQVWELSWTYPKSDLPIFFQLQYWSANRQEDVKTENITGGPRRFTISGASLQPSTLYKARVRTLVVRSKNVNGLPSEWSQETEWTTPPASWDSTSLIYFFVSVFVAMIFTILFFTLPACCQRIALWNGSIPTPIRSQVLEEIMKRKLSAKPTLQNEMEKPIICSVEVLDKMHLSCVSEDCGHPLKLPPGSGPCWSQDPKSAILDPVGPSREAGLNFSGPYILCPGCCLSESRGPDGRDHPGHFLFDARLLVGQPSGGYVGAPPSQDGPGEAPRAQGPPQEHGRAWDGYVTDPGAVMADDPPVPGAGLSDCAPPAYTAAAAAYPAGGAGSGWPEGRSGTADYVSLSKTF